MWTQSRTENCYESGKVRPRLQLLTLNLFHLFWVYLHKNFHIIICQYVHFSFFLLSSWKSDWMLPSLAERTLIKPPAQLIHANISNNITPELLCFPYLALNVRIDLKIFLLVYKSLSSLNIVNLWVRWISSLISVLSSVLTQSLQQW